MDDVIKIQHLKSGIKIDTGLKHNMTTARTNKLAHGYFHYKIFFMAVEVDVKTEQLKQINF